MRIIAGDIIAASVLLPTRRLGRARVAVSSALPMLVLATITRSALSSAVCSGKLFAPTGFLFFENKSDAGQPDRDGTLFLFVFLQVILLFLRPTKQNSNRNIECSVCRAVCDWGWVWSEFCL